MQSKIYMRVAGGVLTASIAVLLYIVFFINPLNSGPAVIMLVFLLLYLLSFSVLFLILHVGVDVVARTKMVVKLNPAKWRVDIKRAYYIASIIAFVPVYLVGMQSLGQLKPQDVLLLITLVGLFIFYILKRT